MNFLFFILLISLFWKPGDFDNWLNHKDRSSRYGRSIIKKHSLAPKLSLQELIKSRISDLLISTKSIINLTPTQWDLRKRALLVLANMRNGLSLSNASSIEGVTSKVVKKYLGDAIKKEKGRWIAKPIDRIQRARWFYSNGERVSVIIDNSETASLISKYLNSVKDALLTRDSSKLSQYHDFLVSDINGKKYPFETNLSKIFELEEMIEEDHTRPIYDDRI